MSQAQRTISYLRAVWPQSETVPPLLQEVLDGCLSSMPNVRDTCIPFRDGHAEIRHRRRAHNKLFLHIACWTDGQPVSVVPHLDDSPDADLSRQYPADGSDYLDGDGMVLVRGNHCMLMPSGMHAKGVERYLRDCVEHVMSTNASLHRDGAEFVLRPIADPAAVRRILEQGGAKRVGLNISRYMRSAMYDERRTRNNTVMGSLGSSVLDALFLSDHLRHQIEEAENVTAKLMISLDGRRSGLKPEELMNVARRASEDDADDDVYIETQNGQRIVRGDLVLRKPIKIEYFGKTVGHGKAWHEMADYFDELSYSGVLDRS